jgi:hypothetical protein
VTGPAEPARPFPTRRLLVTLAALAAALLAGAWLSETFVAPRAAAGPAAVSWWWMLPLVPTAAVAVAAGTGLTTWRRLLAFAWAASALSVAVDALLVAAYPESPRARGAADAPAAFWVVGLLVRWWLFSLLFGAGMLLGQVTGRRGRSLRG